MSFWPLWIKALHVIAVIAWMAGLLYLPRLFVYHADSEIGSRQSETFKTMERRLLRAIMTPAMIVVWITGPVIAYTFHDYMEPWLHAKIALVLLMSGFHGYMARMVKTFAADANSHPARFFRFLNEAPTVLMILIVILVIVRPF